MTWWDREHHAILGCAIAHLWEIIVSIADEYHINLDFNVAFYLQLFAQTNYKICNYLHSWRHEKGHDSNSSLGSGSTPKRRQRT